MQKLDLASLDVATLPVPPNPGGVLMSFYPRTTTVIRIYAILADAPTGLRAVEIWDQLGHEPSYEAMYHHLQVGKRLGTLIQDPAKHWSLALGVDRAKLPRLS